MKKIEVTCKNTKLMSIEQLEKFQGKLKAIDEDSFNKLKKSIINYGFSFPIFVWGQKILDGHQRLAALTKLMSDGYQLEGGKVPIVEIVAENETQAAEKLLLINSRYAKIDQSGFDQFIDDFNIDLSEFMTLIEIPDIQISLIEPLCLPDYSEDEENSDDIVIKIIVNPKHWSQRADDITNGIDSLFKDLKVKAKVQVAE